jgi:hypothetical protein
MTHRPNSSWEVVVAKGEERRADRPDRGQRCSSSLDQ